MKKALKVTSIMCIIFGIHYLALGILALFSVGFGAITSIALLSISGIGATITMILLLGFCLLLTYLYGFGGICALKENRKTALLNMVIATIISIILLIVSLASKKITTSFWDVFAVILPIVQSFFIIQTVD